MHGEKAQNFPFARRHLAALSTTCSRPLVCCSESNFQWSDHNRKLFSEEGWNDWRTYWIGSEQALDYNTGFMMALAAEIELPASFWTTPGGGACTVTACEFIKMQILSERRQSQLPLFC
jgi:hypothetical protein